MSDENLQPEQPNQRRETVRVRIAADDGVTARVWRITDGIPVRDRALPSQELHCELVDLGEQGMRAGLRPRLRESMTLTPMQRLRVAIYADEQELIFDSRLLYFASAASVDGSILCGIEFTHSDRDITSRRQLQVLQRVMGGLQRRAASRRESA